ncbi:MAG: prolipoprotein diacylglyceryl transferase [Clostridiales bacterium]|nr:prolipoprotein diacylglyceryl transferase [Clostridiales bacterium]
MHLNLYGIFIALGVIAAEFYMGREVRRLSLPSDLAVDMALWSVPLAVLFSRIYYVIFTWERYKGDFFSIFRVWEGGLAIYGGVIGGALGVYLLSKRRKIPFFTLTDLVAPGLILGQAIGRWGNFFNGEAFGNAVTDPAWQFFPVSVQVGGSWHLATFFYESLWNLAGFGLLLLLRKRTEKKGQGWLFACYLLWYGLGRMMIEGLRTDSLMLGQLRVSQVVSVALVVIAGALMVYKLKLGKLLLLPSLIGLVLLVLAAFGQAWALPLAYIALAIFVVSVLYQAFFTKAEVPA